ncbi:MAG: helix-turn-helix transcriptional regulator [Eubacteriales bacterium]|nr:helix-turn-helix transcriptional regulator [Eubacteriales bacterium]
MSINAKFSGYLYTYRISNQMTQKKMSELCGVSLRHYQDLEIGRALPNLTNAVHIAAQLNISLDSLKSEVSR